MNRSVPVLLALAACAPPPPPDDAGLASGIAVVASDYQSTTVSLIDPADGTLAREACIDSGTTAPALSQALSGDVVLPSQPNGQGELVLVDRGNSVLTWVDPSDCRPLRQLAVGTGFGANPHDLVTISATKAYVVRYERNDSPTPEPGDFDDGEDLLVIDPSVPRVLGRIDLSALAETVDGVRLLARPERAVLAGGRVYVTLGHQSADFAAGGRGRIAVVDPASDAVVEVVDLPDSLRSCGSLDVAPDGLALAVACGGTFGAAAQEAQSGLALVELSGTAPVVSRVVAATAFGESPLSFELVRWLGAGRVVVARVGSLGGPDDALFLVGPGAIEPSPAFAAGEPFVIGRVAVWAGAGAGRLFVPVASAVAPRLRMYVAGPDSLEFEGEIDATPGTGLPPREAARY